MLLRSYLLNLCCRSHKEKSQELNIRCVFPVGTPQSLASRIPTVLSKADPCILPECSLLRLSITARSPALLFLRRQRSFSSYVLTSNVDAPQTLGLAPPPANSLLGIQNPMTASLTCPNGAPDFSFQVVPASPPFSYPGKRRYLLPNCPTQRPRSRLEFHLFPCLPIQFANKPSQIHFQNMLKCTRFLSLHTTSM